MTNKDIKAKIIICGGRHFNDYNTLETLVDSAIYEKGINYNEIEIISGHCAGADTLGELYAKNHNIAYKLFPAEWTKYGRAAGPIRNTQMVEYASKSTFPIVVAFISPRSKGTMDTVKKATQKGFAIYRYNYDNQ